MRETSILMEKCGDDSLPSGALSGKQEGSWLGWGGAGAVTGYTSFFKCYGK